MDISRILFLFFFFEANGGIVSSKSFILRRCCSVGWLEEGRFRWIDKRRVKHRLVLLFTTFRFRGYRCREHVVGLLFKWIYSTKYTLQVNLKTEEYIYMYFFFTRS